MFQRRSCIEVGLCAVFLERTDDGAKSVPLHQVRDVTWPKPVSQPLACDPPLALAKSWLKIERAARSPSLSSFVLKHGSLNVRKPCLGEDVGRGGGLLADKPCNAQLAGRMRG